MKLRAGSRPRVEGDREQEILDATLRELAKVGYDRMTMDAVATRAKASKATLYRRWSAKSSLVIDALVSVKAGPSVPPDTGSLRGDLIAAFAAPGGFIGRPQLAVFTSILTALATDADLAHQFRERFIGPKLAVSREIYDRAQRRGEIRNDLAVDLIEPALPGIVIHRAVVLGDLPTPELITRVIDQIILPAALRQDLR